MCCYLFVKRRDLYFDKKHFWSHDQEMLVALPSSGPSDTRIRILGYYFEAKKEHYLF